MGLLSGRRRLAVAGVAWVVWGCGGEETCVRTAEDDAQCASQSETPAYYMCEDDDWVPPSDACVALGETGDYCCPGGLGDAKPPAGPGLAVDVEPVPHEGWHPAPEDSWQWQLDGELNRDYDVAVYDVDLFDTPEETIAALTEAGRRAVCYFSAGSSENWRSDFSELPETAMGKPLDGWEGERWLDITDEAVLAVMMKRLDLAVEKGCDGVELDNVDGFANDTGFDLLGDHQLGYNRRLANEAHLRDLAVLLKNDLGQIEALLPYFDGALNEECFLYEECDRLTPFVQAGKPVFQAEYADSLLSAEALGEEICPDARANGFHTLILPDNLDDAFRVTCDR